MNINTLICDYIYSSFLIVKASLEVSTKLAKATLKKLDAFITGMLSLLEFTVDTAISVIISYIQLIQKQIADYFLGDTNELFCSKLFKCAEFLKQLVDPNSLIARSLLKNKTREGLEWAYTIVSDYSNFSEQICKYGFTFSFGISALKNLLASCSTQIKSILELLEKNWNTLRRQIQQYLDLLIDYGIFDLLDRLKAFFNCILDDSASCSSIQTAGSFYKDTLAKLHIEENASGYRFDTQLSNSYEKMFDKRIQNLNQAKTKLEALSQDIVNPSQAKNAANAYNLYTNIFPGGMSLNDIKNGNYKKHKLSKYISCKKSELLEILGYDKSTSFDELTAETKFNEDIIVTSSGYDKDGNYVTKNNIKVPDEYIETSEEEYYMNENSDIDETAVLVDNEGKIISVEAAAVKMNSDTELLEFCKKHWLNVNDFIKQSELTTSW